MFLCTRHLWYHYLETTVELFRVKPLAQLYTKLVNPFLATACLDNSHLALVALPGEVASTTRCMFSSEDKGPAAALPPPSLPLSPWPPQSLASSFHPFHLKRQGTSHPYRRAEWGSEGRVQLIVHCICLRLNALSHLTSQ